MERTIQTRHIKTVVTIQNNNSIHVTRRITSDNNTYYHIAPLYEALKTTGAHSNNPDYLGVQTIADIMPETARIERMIDEYIGVYNGQKMAIELELEQLVCFNLISATEAQLRKDFLFKVYNKDKSDIGRRFREIYKSKGNKATLENDIIENWKEFLTERKGDFSNFLGLLNYRNWLAHGRYWVAKLGQNYNPFITYCISEKIIDMISE